MNNINNIDNNINEEKSGVNNINNLFIENRQSNKYKKTRIEDRESNDPILPINDNIPTPSVLVGIGENEIDSSCPPSANSNDRNIFQIIPSYYIDVILQCFLNIKKVNDFFSNLSEEQINKNNPNLIQLIYMIVQKMKSEGNNDDIAYYLEKINKFLKLKEKCTFKNVLLLILDNIYNDLLGQNGKLPKSEKIYKNKSEAYNHFIKKISHNRFFDLFYGIKKIEYSCAYCYAKYYRCDLFKIISINIDEKKKSHNKNPKIMNSFVEMEVNENQTNNWMNEREPYFDFLNNLYDKILKEKKNSKKYKCNCGSTHVFKGKNIYNICPEILFINFDINFNEKNSFFVDFVLHLDMNNYIENKSPDVDYKYELNSFIEYDLKQEEYITYFKYNNKFIKMTKESSDLIDIDSIDIIKNPVLLFYEKI
jgi:hypothetical protein